MRGLDGPGSVCGSVRLFQRLCLLSLCLFVSFEPALEDVEFLDSQTLCTTLWLGLETRAVAADAALALAPRNPELLSSRTRRCGSV